MAELMDIDGSILEGGGQILRISIALSAILGVPVKVSKIRAARSKPGLAAQHLKGVQLVAEMCQAKLKGAQIGSTEIEFIPGKIKAGHYLADTKTAGSISLLLQVALPVALMADGPVTIDMKGGTNADLAPQIDYMTEVFRPLLRKFGADFQLDIHRRGYYPRGGGHVTVIVSPSPRLAAVDVTQRGDLTSVTGSSFVAGVLPIKVSPDQLRRLWLNMKSRQRKRLIAERQYRMLADRGACPDSLIDVEITNIAEAILEEVPSAQDSDTSFLPENEAVSMSMAYQMSEGVKSQLSSVPRVDIHSYKEHRDMAPDNCSGIIVTAETSSGCILGSDGLGKRGVDSYELGCKVGETLNDIIQSGACVDSYAQDQMIIYMTLADGKSVVRTSEPTLHTKTAIHIAELIAKIKFNIEPIENNYLVECTGLGLLNKNLPPL